MGKPAARKRPEAPENSFLFTIQGIWLPDKPDAARREMRLFSSCVCWVFNRLQEIPKGESGADLLVAEKPLNRIKREAQRLFHLNSRYVADAIKEARAVIDSQKELLPIQIQNLEKRIENLEKAEKKALRILKKPDSVETAERWERKLQSIRLRIHKAVVRKTELENHIQRGTIPKVVFGGRNLLKKLTQSHGERHRELRRKWRLARQGALYSRGDASKSGNPNIRIASEDGRYFTLQAVLSHQAECQGTDKLGRPLMSDAPKVGGSLWIPDKFRLLLMETLFSGCPYSVQIMEDDAPESPRGDDAPESPRGDDAPESPRGEIRPEDAPFSHADSENTVFRVHITIDRQAEVPEPKVDLSRGVLGMDENPHGIALANVGPNGNLEPFPEGFSLPEIAGSQKSPVGDSQGSFAGDIQAGLDPRGTIWLHVPEFRTARGFRRTYLAGVAAKFICDVARALNKPIALEDLDFGQTLEKGQSPNFNRLASGFNHGKVIWLIERRARREGVPVIQVDPAFTSVIGGFKYQASLGLSVHQAAAFTIGRRALRKRERIAAGKLQRMAPGNPQGGIQKLREDIQSALRRLPELVPGEGTSPFGDSEASRGAVGGQLKRLLGLLSDERILIHNGFLTGWVDRKRTGIWGSISLARKLLVTLGNP